MGVECSTLRVEVEWKYLLQCFLVELDRVSGHSTQWEWASAGELCCSLRRRRIPRLS